MNNKKLGIIIFILAIILGAIIYSANNHLSSLIEDACNNPQSCNATHEEPITIHSGIAVIFTLLSLSLYILFFEKSEKRIMEQLKEDAKIKSSEEKFKFILMGLNKDERKILTAIREQDGISQNTLGIRINMHKSKLSVLIGILEEKELIKKEKNGKNNQLFLRVKL
jgi:uncharacterized membrane protein